MLNSQSSFLILVIASFVSYNFYNQCSEEEKSKGKQTTSLCFNFFRRLFQFTLQILPFQRFSVSERAIECYFKKV